MAYIYPAPGVAGAQAVLTVSVTGQSGNLLIPAMQDITINNANDVFTWTQLDQGSKQNVATTATNSLSMNIVLDQTIFFGDSDAAVSGSAEAKGVFGLSRDKTLVQFSLFLGTEDDGGAGKTISGEAYVTGLAPTVSADAPVWVTPITLTVDGDYSVA